MGYKAAVVTVSDKGFRGEREDTSGPQLVQMLLEHGYEVVYTNIVPDEKELIEKELTTCADEKKISLVLTTGGTGFSQRDITPEATKAVIEREAQGVAELMRLKSLQITEKACLSRAIAGIRKQTLIINLPGSSKAAKENLEAVISSLDHGLEVLNSNGSLNCGDEKTNKRIPPSLDDMLKEAKADSDSSQCGMYLTHVGTVRQTSRQMVRDKIYTEKNVESMEISSDSGKVADAISDTYALDGVYYVSVWLNDGILHVGEDIMRVIVGGDTRPHTVDALQFIVDKLKNECIKETENLK